MAMSTTPVLTLPNYDLPFTVETDASDVGLGAVLMQKGRPIAYLSKALAPKHQSYSTYEKELLALVLATTKWHHYLQGHHFIVKTDHQSLKYLLEQRWSTTLQQKWLVKLPGMDYEIVYKKGKDNKVTDVLSRLPGMNRDVQLKAISSVQFNWLHEVTNSYNQDVCAQEAIRNLTAGGQNHTEWQFQQGVLKFQGRINIGSHG